MLKILSQRVFTRKPPAGTLARSVAAKLWQLHPEADFFLARGGHEIRPPVVCNLALTNKCNLRCEICGSQKFLDETGVLRRHMEFSVFQSVAQTLFPFMGEVELNSQGDPLLHPRIADIVETIGRYDCDLKVQTNGTLFSDRIIDVLVPVCGIVQLSLDAVGPRFDEVRRGGSWRALEPQLTRYLKERNPSRQQVGIYPTLTKRTLSEALNIVRWARDYDIEQVNFHRYSAIKNSFEEPPTPTDLETVRTTLTEWLSKVGDRMTIRVDGVHLNKVLGAERRTQVGGAHKRAIAPSLFTVNIFPTEAGAPGSDPLSVCPAAERHVEIGLDGQISVCCRAQDVTLGYATSVEQFANAWFGENYRKIRRSLHRDADGAFPLPNCEACIQFHVPNRLRGRRAASYDEPSPGPEKLNFGDLEQVRLEIIQRERGHCYIARIPIGIGGDRFQLWENETPLGPDEQVHEHIRELGHGRYSLWGRQIYFSTSDNSDARTNHRVYRLVNVQHALAGARAGI